MSRLFLFSSQENEQWVRCVCKLFQKLFAAVLSHTLTWTSTWQARTCEESVCASEMCWCMWDDNFTRMAWSKTKNMEFYPVSRLFHSNQSFRITFSFEYGRMMCVARKNGVCVRVWSSKEMYASRRCYTCTFARHVNVIEKEISTHINTLSEWVEFRCAVQRWAVVYMHMYEVNMPMNPAAQNTPCHRIISYFASLMLIHSRRGGRTVHRNERETAQTQGITGSHTHTHTDTGTDTRI